MVWERGSQRGKYIGPAQGGSPGFSDIFPGAMTCIGPSSFVAYFSLG